MSARCCRLSSVAKEQSLELEDYVVFLTDLHNYGSHRLNKSVVYVWIQPEICSWFSFQSLALSESRFERKQSFLRAIKSNCVCKAREVFFVFSINACGSRIMPNVEVWAFLLLLYYCVSTNMESHFFWSFKGTGRQGEFEFRFALGKSFTTHIRIIRPLHCSLQLQGYILSFWLRRNCQAFSTMTMNETWRRHCQTSLHLCLILTYITRFLCISNFCLCMPYSFSARCWKVSLFKAFFLSEKLNLPQESLIIIMDLKLQSL